MPPLVAIITAVAFLPALRAGFVSWDDDKNFLANPNYRGLGAANLHWMWSTFLLGHYVPLSWMTLGLDYTLWGMNPAGYHLTNVLLHALNAALLYWITLRVLRAAGAEAGTPTILAAAIGALLFSLHPLRVESVAWITERRDVLSGVFYLASVLCYLRAGTGRFRSWYAASLALFVCALLSKGTAVTLPVALVALNVYPLRRLPGDGWSSAGARRVYAEVLPFALLAAGASALTLVALQQMTQLPATGKIAVSAYSLAFYLYKTVLPLRLSPIYAMPEHVDPTALEYVASYGVVIAVTVAALSQWRRRPAITVAWLAFVAIIFPMLGVHQNGPQIAADRYTYSATPVLSLLAAAALLLPLARRPAITALVAGLLLATIGMVTWKQTEVWQDSTSLWSRVLTLDSASSYGHNNWGNLLLQEGKVDEAQAHYERAVTLAPDYAQAHNNLGITFARQGRFDEAIPEYQRALAIEPGYDEPHNNWGIALARAGQLDSAVAQFRLALAANPDNADAEINWGNALVRAGKPSDAIPHYEESLRIRPDNADAYLNWGVALALQARWNEAIAQFQAALRISPDNAEAKAYLAEAIQRRG